MLPDGALPPVLHKLNRSWLLSTKRTAQAIADMKALADPVRAAHSQKYFRTGPGQYGAGDRFLGIRVPQVRKVAARYRGLDLQEVEQLLRNHFHEIRLLALLILVERFKKAGPTEQKAIYDIYMQDRRWINNWDLVDVSAPVIVGGWVQPRSHNILSKLARSRTLWDRRISVMATFWLIRANDFNTALAIAELLLQDKEDLIHKAVGWMLREIGKRNRSVEEQFLKTHYRDMPRTMLRYAIEKFPESLRKCYRQGKVSV